MAGTLSTEGRGVPPVAFAGGGTAGHVFPGLAVAERLDRRIVWIGSRDGVEKGLVTGTGVDFRGIPAGKLRRYLSPRNLSDIFKILAGILASVRILRRERPALLFSKGGFVSVPPVIAARLCGIPAWTHESDFDPGLATRINLRFCEKVLVSFPETLRFLPPAAQAKAVVTGNPVRAAMYAADPARGRRFAGCPDGKPFLFVIGGSLGSSFLNGLIRSSLPLLLPRFIVMHQTGEKDYAASEADGYIAAAFIGEELPDVMAAADLVVSRAGANTLAELAALGRPSLLIPLPQSSSRGDQLRNAEVFRSHGAAEVLPEEQASPQSLLVVIRRLFSDPGRLQEMGRAASALAGGRPAEAIASLIRRRLGPDV
jgi:UDP-N-acetylglucosamine--N-acetylmuramyl-(pentapeptide) pyrophosphoryl-undecaprenol N-acetylglucosamine transferase